MKKSIPVILFLGINSISRADTFIPYRDTSHDLDQSPPISISINEYNDVHVFDKRSTIDMKTLKNIENPPILVTKVAAFTPNGRECQLKESYGEKAPFELNRLQLLFRDISEDGCYPKMEYVIVETESDGIWEYKRGLGTKEITEIHRPKYNVAEVSLDIDHNNGIATLKSNVDSITVTGISVPYNGAIANDLRATACRFTLPNSNRNSKKLKLGEEVIYQFNPKVCGYFDSVHVGVGKNIIKKLQISADTFLESEHFDSKSIFFYSEKAILSYKNF